MYLGCCQLVWKCRIGKICLLKKYDISPLLQGLFTQRQEEGKKKKDGEDDNVEEEKEEEMDEVD